MIAKKTTLEFKSAQAAEVSKEIPKPSSSLAAKDGDSFDVIIVGGGPSGSSCAMYLGKAGKKVLLLDRAKFPRDKTCGDGISGKSVGVLKELGMLPEMEKVEHMKMYGVTFSNPKGTVVKIDTPSKDPNLPPGFVCRREVFDNVLFQNAKKFATTIEQFFVNDLIQENGIVTGVTGNHMPTGQKMTFTAKVIVGADGVGGVVAKKFNAVNTKEDHQCSALRAYYKGVKGMNDTIELHFVEELLPGYFWIFPLPDGKANVGVGMLVSDIKSTKSNMEKIMFSIIENHPVFKARFEGAERISDVKRWQLPLGSNRVKCFGDGYLIIGDAGSLIDPFSGEGIGNSLISGKISSQIIAKAFEKNDFSAVTLVEYETELSKEIDGDLKNSYRMQKWGKHKWLLNWMIDKAANSEKMRRAISSSLLHSEEKSKFSSLPEMIKMILFN
ncbi:MAG: NAD(P)/FAD-dependent oxidoreductase [Candidatus Micrarchaeota archaeon]|nr:NAD(P)/FAD-dependent oxidoreductase [Candidatus Micrarchaeota archaeon]